MKSAPVDCAFEKLAEWVGHAVDAWKEAGKTTRPFVSTTCWYALGPDAESVLKSYVYDYMAIFGDRAARAMADRQVVSSEEALHRACETIAETGWRSLWARRSSFSN